MHELAFFLQSQPNPELVRHIFMMLVPIMIIFWIVAVAIVMIPCWFILRKAGFTPWLALLCIIPSLGTLVLLYVLAFAEWKVVPALQPGGSPLNPPPQPFPPPQG
jgi:heme/copper-type cytochrome/quinol oxidase subunit 2